MNKLFLAWQDSVSRAWFPIGQLTKENNCYQFVYIQGALSARQQCGFEPLRAFPDFDKVYESPELFPLFSNRLMPRSRPDYADFVEWLNIPKHADDPIALLARSSGERATDTLAIFPASEPDEHGMYHLHFFAHGLRHLPSGSIGRIYRLKVSDNLRLVHDLQNPYDSRALMLCTEDGYSVGYCPRYLLDDVFDVLRQYPKRVKVGVERINQPPTPLQFRLLCNLTVIFPDEFQPFSSLIYQPVANNLVSFA